MPTPKVVRRRRRIKLGAAPGVDGAEGPGPVGAQLFDKAVDDVDQRPSGGDDVALAQVARSLFGDGQGMAEVAFAVEAGADGCQLLDELADRCGDRRQRRGGYNPRFLIAT